MSSGSYIEGWCKKCGEYSKNSAIATHGLCCACYHQVVVGTPASNEWRKKEAEKQIRVFFDRLAKGMKPLPPEFADTVNKSFWDLVG